MRLPAIQVDWSELPVERLLRQVVEEDEREVVAKGDVTQVRRPDLELAWTELAFLDISQHKEARSRICLGRGANIQPLITMEYWPEDAEWFGGVWDEVLRSLQLGVYVKDPMRRDTQ